MRPWVVLTAFVRLLHRFCLYIGAYGCVTAVATSMLFGCWLIDLNAYTFIFHILGRIYSLTALISLYIAHEWRTEMAKEPTATQSPRTHMGSSNPCKVTGISATEPVIQVCPCSKRPLMTDCDGATSESYAATEVFTVNTGSNFLGT
ncbi:hypothetical protein F5878DRAFT_306380 [Lentinula raphanica]|uniref:Uncharacterized protein n=1 Tax=Lentinula raphanica TaxID=153919 RepID=A0AA38P393_9AGAR|nr:hypothetical protein F5878DRAFT_306380 [Lentinula raphanica]